MGIALNHPAEGTVNWAGTVGANFTTLQNQYVARIKGDTTSASVSGTTSETLLMANTTVKANTFAAGSVIPVWACGFIQVPANAAPTITWRLRWGGLSGVQLANVTFRPNTSTSAQVFIWTADVRLFCATAGSSGTVDSEGWLMPGSLVQTLLSTGLSTIDTTADKVLCWTGQTTVSTVTITQDNMATNLG
ncbi:MAG TPA: hypothetical protein VFF73_25575 [Planctomycetota bacterium]|nr:hypothetical protein [Planctomycetota bacterium]